MPDEPTSNVYPRGFGDEFPEGPPTVVIRHGGCLLILRFAAGDIYGVGLVQELRLLPDEDELQPRVLRRFAPNAELYLAYARAAMNFWRMDEDPEGWQDRMRRAVEALRAVAGPGRGLPDRHYEAVAYQYKALVDGGEPHPVKALAEKNHVTISAASRWLKEARARGHVKEASDAS